MSESLLSARQSPVLTIDQWLNQTVQKLQKSQNESSRLDAELILSYILKKNRMFLHAHGENVLSVEEKSKANQLSSRRLKGTPIAYLTGYKDFYGYSFLVSPDTLIPRPESEQIVTEALNLVKRFTSPVKILDIGCGCGNLGLSLAKELEQLRLSYELTLSDISPQAINIARLNANRLNLHPQFIESDLLSNIPPNYNLILANLPYVDRDWSFTKNLVAEPELALYANDMGMEIIKKLLNQLIDNRSFCSKGYIILESDTSQLPELARLCQIANFNLIEQHDYLTIIGL